MTRKTTILLGLLLVLSAGVALWASMRMSDAADTARLAAANLGESQDLVRRIVALRDRSVGEGGGQPLDISTRIRQAADAAGMGDSLRSIPPGQPRPLRNSDYSEVPIPLPLEGVEARQLVTFLHAVSQPEIGLNVKDIRMTRDGSTWNANVTLTYLVYTPRPTR